MNDADIKKALECCQKRRCTVCPYDDKGDTFVECNGNLVKDALVLINRERSDAIKEFAERLKQSAFDCDVSFGYGKEHYTEAVAVIEIDNLVKEMTEGKNDNTNT